jgi:serine/threonine protein kinase
MTSPTASLTDPVAAVPDDVTGTASAQSEETQAIQLAPRSTPSPDEGDVLTDLEPFSTAVVVNPKPGDRIETYILQKQLGCGVSCHVFESWDEVRQRPVAVKIVNWGNVYDRTAALKQMRTEAAALARVNHLRVVRFIDFGFDSRWPYLVTEFVYGRSLGELIRSGGALPVDWALCLINQLVDGLGAVWRAGIVHRDIKPDNVLISPDGAVKLIDFGLAKVDVLKLAEEPTGPELAGTAAYLAPEQAKDAAWVDLRADIYSLGVMFYEMLTGRLPFEGRNRVQMIFQHLNNPPRPPSQLNPNIPELVNALCLWMLVKNPDKRPQTHDELKQAFVTVSEAVMAKRV